MANFIAANSILTFSADSSQLFVLDTATSKTTAFDLSNGVSLHVSGSDLQVSEGVEVEGGALVDITGRQAGISFNAADNTVFISFIGADELELEGGASPVVGNSTHLFECSVDLFQKTLKMKRSGADIRLATS